MMFAAALLAGIVVQAAAQPRDEPTARDVLDKYSALLASLPTGRGVVRNISELPYPKTVIKIALLELLVGTNDAKERNTIEVAYIGLASFQEMTAEENEAVRKWDEIMRSDPATTSGTELAQADSWCWRRLSQSCWQIRCRTDRTLQRDKKV
jgi:hypothetical protein